MMSEPVNTWRRMTVAAAILCTAACAQFETGPREDVLLRAPDHVLLWSQEARAAPDLFEQLGFFVKKGQTYPEGISSSTVVFGDWSYIELLHFSDPARALVSAQARAELAFVAQGPGANSFAVQVSDAGAARNFLRQRGFSVAAIDQDMVDPDGPTGPSPPEPASWRDFHFAAPPVAGSDVFFIQYPAEEASSAEDDAAFQRRTAHRNSARQLSAVWLLVDDLDAAADAYLRMEFSVGPTMEVTHLNGRARVASLGGGSVVLVQSPQLPERFRTLRQGPGVIGLSIKVASLAQAPYAKEVEGLPTRDGPFGESVVALTTGAIGLFLEFHE